MSDPIHIISLGAGVQSSTMALMAAAGEITPMPHCAIFADTKAEPKAVYKWLDWLEDILPFPVYRVSKGSLEADTLKIRTRKDGLGQWNPSGIPAFIKNSDGSRGITPRQCTHDFKILPIQRKTRELLKEAKIRSAVKWIGISLDEISRIKPSQNRYEIARWPLIELRKNRHDCMVWMVNRGFPIPPRSSCVFCPYHNDYEWHRLKVEEPRSFSRAVRFERKYQAAKHQTSTSGVPFLHDSLIPLNEVDFSTEEDKGQINLFQNECEGMCGV